MKRLLIIPLIVFVSGLMACGLVEGDDEETYDGAITVGLTEAIGGDGTYNLRNIFTPEIPEVLAIVQVENAEAGMEVTGEWIQLATIQQRAPNQTASGIIVSEAGFTLTQEAIDVASGRGGGTLRLVPNAPLPADSYLLRVYIDGALARTAGFVVVDLTPEEAPPPEEQPPAEQPPAEQPPTTP